MIEINNILDVEKHISRLKVILFDLDDTLFSEKDYIRSGYKEIAKYNKNIPDMENKLWQAFINGYKAIDYVLEQAGMLEKKEEYLKIYRNHAPTISLYCGVKEMLERIKKSKMIGIITDGRPEGQRAKLKALNLINEKFIITDELGGIACRKPNPISFKIMKDYYNVNYTEMAYVGDNLTKDFVAPEKLGMVAIFFKNNNGLYFNKNLSKI